MKAAATGVVALILCRLLIAGSDAHAQAVLDGCVEDTYNAYGSGGTLNCTANDIAIVDVLSLTIDPADDGCAYVGDTVTFDAQFLTQVNAQQRQDIGFYLATDAGDAITGTCFSDVLSLGDPGVVDLDGTGDDTSNNNAFGYCSPDAGATLSSPVQPCNADSDCATAPETCEEFGPGIQDTCGDMDQSNAGTCSLARTGCALDADCPVTETCELGTAVSSVQDVTVLCVDDDTDGFADLRYSASWRIAGTNELCLSPLAAFPGNASKCKAGIPNSAIPIGTQTLNVIKTLSPISDPGLFDLEIDSVVELSDAGDGDATGPVGVTPGSHTVSESAGTGTVLSAYSSDISCVETLGSCVSSPGIACLADSVCDDASAGDTCDLTPVTVASCTDCTSLAVTVPSVQSAIECTITNSNNCAGVDCSGLDDACNVGQCNPATGSCEAAPLPDGTSCADGTVCNGLEACLAGVCEPGTPLVCDDNDVCDGAETCDPIAGCQPGVPLVCDNGQFCDGNESCNPLSGCVAGTPPVCADGVACTVDACDEANDVCTSSPDDLACSNGNACDGAESCDAVAGCQAGAPLVCDNGQFCDGNESCNPLSGCVAGTPPVCTDSVACTVDACDEANDVCTNAPDDLACSNSDVCDGIESCDAAAGCQAGTPLVCDNGQFCDGSESCNPASGCVAGTAITCSDGTACTVDLCDEANDLCTNTPNDLACDDGVSCTVDSCTPIVGCQNAADDTLCDNGLFCDGDEVCNPTVGCEAGFAVACPDDGFSCTAESCDEDADQCVVDNTCICGNALVEPGEACDPPTGLEDCNNMLDDDGDGAIDCADSDCQNPSNPGMGITTCGEDCLIDLPCQPIQKDPARFVFGRDDRLDKFKIHGRMLRMMSSFDIADAGFSVLVTNANGVVFSEYLAPGQLEASRWGNSYRYKNRYARIDGGFKRAVVKRRTIRGIEYLAFYAVVFGDYSAASLPTMTTQIVIGDHAATLTRDWLPTRRGWLLRDRDF